MQHHLNENKSAIPPNLLKNFNVYEILEPEKTGAKTSDATKVDKLIDIDDCSGDSGFQDSDLNPVFFDKIKDFDLVDLYQNIYVTPQHIKKKEADGEDGETCTSKVLDPGFKQFFDMLESGQKIDWTNTSQSIEESVANHDYIDKKPRVLVPKVFTEPDSDPEDVINEVLTQKNIERLVLRHNSNLRNPSASQDRETPKNLKIPDVIPKLTRLNLNGVTKDSNSESGSNKKILRPSEIEPYPVKNQISNSLPTFTVKAIQKDEKVYKKKRLLKPENQTANFTAGPDFYEKSVVLPQIMARLYARLDYLEDRANQKKRLILDTGVPPAKSECSTSNANGPAKPAIVSCNKLTKNEPVKTKPKNSTMKEMKLCVNKITKNISVHVTDKPCPNCSNPSSTKKTNYPTGIPIKTGQVELSPTVLMEDCNKERLRALKQSQMFKDFVLKGKYEH